MLLNQQAAEKWLPYFANSRFSFRGAFREKFRYGGTAFRLKCHRQATKQGTSSKDTSNLNFCAKKEKKSFLELSFWGNVTKMRKILQDGYIAVKLSRNGGVEC